MQFHSELWNLKWYFGSLGPVLPPDLGLDPGDTLPSFRRVLRGDTVVCDSCQPRTQNLPTTQVRRLT
jgi:hypothetical protein